MNPRRWIRVLRDMVTGSGAGRLRLVVGILVSVLSFILLIRAVMSRSLFEWGLYLLSVVVSVLVILEFRLLDRTNHIATEQKKEIEELSKAQTRFFSSMSHEIRTPINTIIGLDEMILREEISDEVAEDAENILDASRMLLALINDILDMSKVEAGKMELVPAAYDTGEMLSDIVNLVWSRAKEKGLEFHVDVDQTMPAVLYGDAVRIKQIMINLLTNAVKYTREGSVTFSITCRRLDRNRARITYSVADTGMGIKKENIPYLFSAFQRVDEEKNRFIEGTGLGLSIVKQFVDLMGGEITVNSVYTKGSTFLVDLEQGIVDNEDIGELNLESRHALNTREHYRQSFEAPGAGVLIVDDNEANLMVESKLLRDTRMKIDTASSGEEALEKAVQTHYDVILMDHLMPGMSGIECLHEIRLRPGSLNRNTPVIVLTANAGSENQALYEREGFDGYLLKPVSGFLLETELIRHLPREAVKIINTAGIGKEVGNVVRVNRKKLPVVITTDSVCDLPSSLMTQRNIQVLPYRIHTDRGIFLDGVETESTGLLLYLKNEEQSARSEPPTVEDYETFFANVLSGTHQIIHISMSGQVSEGYRRALEAADSFDNVRVIDSENLSSGMGLLVLLAESLSHRELTPEMLEKEILDARERICTSFIVDSTTYLARSGRLNSWLDRLSHVFLMHPVVQLQKGRMRSRSVHFGIRARARSRYIRSALEVYGTIDTETLFIVYAGLTMEELKEIERQVLERVPFKNVIFEQASPAIAINCGPGSFGLIFMKEA